VGKKNRKKTAKGGGGKGGTIGLKNWGYCAVGNALEMGGKKPTRKANRKKMKPGQKRQRPKRGGGGKKGHPLVFKREWTWCQKEGARQKKRRKEPRENKAKKKARPHKV